jgi:hypothetical protein
LLSKSRRAVSRWAAEVAAFDFGCGAIGTRGAVYTDGAGTG